MKTDTDPIAEAFRAAFGTVVEVFADRKMWEKAGLLKDVSERPAMRWHELRSVLPRQVTHTQVATLVTV